MTIFGQTGQGLTPDGAEREATDAGSLPGAAFPAATAHAKDRLRTIVEHQPACLAEVAADGRVLAMNEAQVALMGSHGGGRLYHDLASLTDRERVGDFIRQVTEGHRGSLEYLMVTPDAGSCDVVTDGVPLDRGPDRGAVALLVTRDLTEYRGLEHQIQQEAAEHVRERAELEMKIQAAEERTASAVAGRGAERGREGLAADESGPTRADLDARIEAAEARAESALAERDAERGRVELAAQNDANERAELEARIEAAEERERAFVVARAAERNRVGEALERARVQLLELKDLRDQAATHGRGLSGGLPVARAASHEHATVVA